MRAPNVVAKQPVFRALGRKRSTGLSQAGNLSGAFGRPDLSPPQVWGDSLFARGRVTYEPSDSGEIWIPANRLHLARGVAPKPVKPCFGNSFILTL